MVPLDALDSYALSAPQALLREALKRHLAPAEPDGQTAFLEL